MSVEVEIKNLSNLRKVKELLGAKTYDEAVEMALDGIIAKFEQKSVNEDLLAKENKAQIIDAEKNL